MLENSSNSAVKRNGQMITFEFPSDTRFPLQGPEGKMWERRNGKIVASFEREILELCFALAERLGLDSI